MAAPQHALRRGSSSLTRFTSCSQLSSLSISRTSTRSSHYFRKLEATAEKGEVLKPMEEEELSLKALADGWLEGPGSAFKDPLHGSTNYLNAYSPSGKLFRLNTRKGEEGSEANATSDGQLPPERLEDLMPFPLNTQFRSQSVLSEELREEIYNRVVVNGSSVRSVSAEFSVSMERVGAVVRMKQIEKDWQKDGKSLAKPYAQAVLNMLPTTPYIPNDPQPHEDINDLPVHSHTTQQIFYPTSESRDFTRADAGRAFNTDLLPADARIPHPQLIEEHRERNFPPAVRQNLIDERERREIQDRERRKQKMMEREKRQVTVVPGKRHEFRFKDISVDSVGKNGRSPAGVGWRYGFPHEDRKRGQVKIPTRVDT
ncbi:hypothetical protein P152DRAFT_454949 [Eremomyces bilateralis CBS 781.70]|uniref:Ribosomal protein S35, mitochondrial n=1 Tax=Eremomyces bilateralis CBS 781.70 TaxID=1392243 RepID=A0A6G1GFM7_9PEZI|nr:uncharacterized protein P152DRAFT_454949 [Eremomyces bilateralis CBS 781.70]KAF1816721.1 hypothetical protein P152DRAFT_454949 [Eremomyces bilateralis CBS 781.70]